MKSWLGVIGRACLEFLLILALISLAAGASLFLAQESSGFNLFFADAGRAALNLAPLAVVFTLFLAFFSFELRVKSRAAGWLGLLCLGALLMSFGLGLRRLSLVQGSASPSSGQAQPSIPLPAGVAVQEGRVALWIGGYKGGEAVNAIAVDFGSDYPRLAYAPTAPVDRKTGSLEIQGRSYPGVEPSPAPIALVPEAGVFAGSWIWDRLAALDDRPIHLAFAVAGGFLFLGIGFRFLCRITGWPLANALVAAAGLAALVVLDAYLSGPEASGAIAELAKRVGLSLPGALELAALEGIAGLILGVIDVAGSRRSRRLAHE
jgi:hypothetical protein